MTCWLSVGLKPLRCPAALPPSISPSSLSSAFPRSLSTCPCLDRCRSFFFFFHASTAEKYKFVAYFGIYLLMNRVNIISRANTFTVGISIQLLLFVLELLSHLVSVWIRFVLFTLQFSLCIFLPSVKFIHIIQTTGMINISKKKYLQLKFWRNFDKHVLVSVRDTFMN